LLYARGLSDSAPDAEDAVHDGFLRFWKAHARARDRPALFFACVRSAALDRRRADRRRARREQRAADAHPLFAADDADAVARREWVEKALAQLPPDQREVVVLKLWAGLTFAEIAAGVGAPLHTVAARYRYGLEKLTALLTPEGQR
jgi:RNA polymerase sigma-70 factor (ECF subfamily)